MIGKIIIGTNFGPALTYVLAERKQDLEVLKTMGVSKATVLKYNNCFGDNKELLGQFNEVRRLNQKVTRAVLHLILAFDIQDRVLDSQMVEIIEKLGKKMGFHKNQYIAVTHNDTDHRHIHLIINRISYDRKTLSDSNDYKAISEFSREIELEYGFRQVLSPKRFLPKEEREQPRNDLRLESFKKIFINDVLPNSKNWDELQYNLLEKGATMIKGRGLVFIDEKGVRIKSSQIGLSILQIEQFFLANMKSAPLIMDVNSEQKISVDSLGDSSFPKLTIQMNFFAIIQAALKTCKTWIGLETNLVDHGISIVKGRGVTFISKDSARVKGSDIGLSIKSIEAKFLQNHDDGDLHSIELKRKQERILSTSHPVPEQISRVSFETSDKHTVTKYNMTAIIKSALITCKSWIELEDKIARKGISFERGRDIIFSNKDSLKIGGIEMNLSINTIENKFLQNNMDLAQEKSKTYKKYRL